MEPHPYPAQIPSPVLAIMATSKGSPEETPGHFGDEQSCCNSVTLQALRWVSWSWAVPGSTPWLCPPGLTCTPQRLGALGKLEAKQRVTWLPGGVGFVQTG